MKDFILPPYEYPGADFSPKAHAESRLEIGGKKRNFVLKMRDGVIYFKEPSRGQIYAIPQLFAPELAGDSIGLVSTWQREVAAGNYGAFVVKRDYFQGLPVRGQFLMVVQASGQGWMKEHFDTEWFLLPEAKNTRLYEIWNPKILEVQIKDLLVSVKASLLQRIVEPEVRRDEVVRWIGGTSEEFSSLFIAAARIFLPTCAWAFFSTDSRLYLKSHSAFAKGEIENSWFKYACGFPKFKCIWEVLEREFYLMGVKWSEGGEQMELYQRRRVEKTFKTGLQQWGEDWRGNWAPQRGSFEVSVEYLGEQSAHERLESLLLLREWLRGKMPDDFLEKLLKE